MITVPITIEEYEDLLEDSKLLGYLYAQGLDNWDGFEYAIEQLREDGGLPEKEED